MVLTATRTNLPKPVPITQMLESESWKNCSVARFRDERLPGPAAFSHHCLGVTGVTLTRDKE